MIFSEVYWQEHKGMFVKIDNKDYFVYGGFDDDNYFSLFINRCGNFITFDKNNNRDEYLYLLEALANYPINRYIFNNIVDTLDKLNVKHTMVKR